MIRNNCLATLFLFLMPTVTKAIDYPYSTAEPQKSGWPLTAEERAYVVDKPEHDRRPGREANKHLPSLWPIIPSAGHFGGDAWLKLHEAHVKTVQANAGPVEVLLVGDSITIQWGESWKKHFPDWKAVNIGIGGDKTQNVLWRLDHGGVEGLQPKAIVLMIGNNNMFFTPETGIKAAAQGIEMCVKNLREKFSNAKIVVTKIIPAHAPDNRFHKDILATNAALDAFKLNSDPQVQVLDLTGDFLNDDGKLKKDLYTPDDIHLSPSGYAVYASRLKPLLEAMLAGKPVPAQPAKKISASALVPAPKAPTLQASPKAAASITLLTKPILTYPYTSYNEGKMDPQLTGCVPASAAAQGIKLCIDNLRLRCPQSQLAVVKILPAFVTSKEVGAKVREINAALDELKIDSDEKVQVVDLWNDFTNADGTLRTSLYSDGHLHLGPDGYEVLAAKLKSVLIPR